VALIEEAAAVWSPPLSVSEKLRRALVPAPLYVRYTAERNMREGEAELAFLRFLVRPGGVAIDAGANIGVWSYWMGRIARQVHAFEPNPKIFAILKDAQLPNTSTHEIALSDAPGSVDLLVPKGGRGYSNQGASLSATKVSGAHGKVRVEARTLDSYAFEDVCCIKIDVEGHELAVIAGAAETLKRWRPTLIVEIEERHTRRPLAELIGAIEAHGYEAFCLRRGALVRFPDLCLDTHHRATSKQGDYVFNFIFLPRQS
jgi:FkbM family methyltransferase